LNKNKILDCIGHHLGFLHRKYTDQKSQDCFRYLCVWGKTKCYWREQL